ncbi:MAG: ABC transporter permease [Candidatus Adiutricales bacterium]
MRAYIVRRVLLMIPTFILVTMTVFFAVRLIPGSVIDQMIAEMAGSGTDIYSTRQEIQKAMGLDEPIHIQYVKWFGGILHGDLGKSLWTREPVMRSIMQRLPITAELGFLALVVGLSIALPIGTFAAVRQDTRGDYLGRTIAIIFISVPSFWIGTMVVVYPSIWLNWSPPVDLIPLRQDFFGNFKQFILPASIMGMVMSGGTMRMTRTMMLEVLRQDYIRTAWEKGLTERAVVMKHALKNALIPVVSMVGMSIPIMIAGSVIIEQIFTLPGIGLLLIEALNKRDYPIISGIIIFIATAVIVINLIVDLIYTLLDPRTAYK